jgi:murein DD-endopeptidase MepM/ murein hydrolase activator NlpD
MYLMNRYVTTFLIFMILMVLSAGIFFFITYYEGEKPVITVLGDPDMIGREKMLEIKCSDGKSGIRNVSVSITQDKKRYQLETTSIPRRGVVEQTIPVLVHPKDLRLHDGAATLDISVVDYSLRKNMTNKTLAVTIDTIPPRISQLNAVHYANPGGSAVTVYSIPEEITKTYVYVGENVFSSYPLTLAGKSGYICYFALPLDSKNLKGNAIGIAAEDKAGNISKSVLPMHIRTKSFRNRTMNISKNFLERKIPELEQYCTMTKYSSLIDAFRYINNHMRAENLERIRSICKKSADRQLWNGPFIRMQNAATMARFGDKRTYVCEGQKIGTSIHAGIDLASVRNAIVHASNTGTVVFAGYIGIFGNSILIDHGLGLFSLYSHLGTIDVSENQSVTKGTPIGRTDTSGLAGGDHLHFGIFVGNQFVDPQEWWDPHWIRDNVDKKLAVTF